MFYFNIWEHDTVAVHLTAYVYWVKLIPDNEEMTEIEKQRVKDM
jgi:predicted transcriptional regulator